MAERVAEQQRPRRRDRAAAMATPLSATFLGLLLVHGFTSADAGEAGAGQGHGRGGGAGGGPDQGGGAGGAVTGGGGPIGAGGGVDAGSVLAAADLFDPSALVQLSGTARFADGLPAGLAGGDGSIGSGAELTPVRAAPADVVLGLGAMPGTTGDGGGELPPPDVDEDPDSDNGPIGNVDDGTDGDDTLHGTPGDDHLDGGNGNDTIYGHDGDDSLVGGNGNDSIYGGNGNDDIGGNAGDDLLYGGNGNDTLDGGTGNDSAYGGNGNDSLIGGEGDDLVDGGNGIDTMTGNTGRDILVIDNIHDLAMEDGEGQDGGGIDMLDVTAGYQASLREALPHLSPDGLATFVLGHEVGVEHPNGTNAYTQQVQPFIENVRLRGDAAHDILGDGRDNTLIGNDGDNRLYGGAGDDLLKGGGGDDWLAGGAGEDELWGDDGNDVFVLGLNDSAVDTVFDHSGVNSIRLNGASADKLGASLLGDDLHLSHDGKQIAIIRDWLGHESAFDGVDTGSGKVTLGDILARGSADPDPDPTPDSAPDPDPGDLLSSFLPDIKGTAGNDILYGTAGGDRIAGLAGNDTLAGSGGDDTLDGGAGSDRLEGGPGSDTFRIVKGEGVDQIYDLAGKNTIQLEGFGEAKLGAFLSGQDLWVTADSETVAVVNGYAAHPESLASIKAGAKVVDPNELLTS